MKDEARKIVINCVISNTPPGEYRYKLFDVLEKALLSYGTQREAKGFAKGLRKAAAHLRRWRDINYNDRARDILTFLPPEKKGGK